MDSQALRRELERLQALPTTTEDWRDLYETIEAYQRRRLVRAIAGHPKRDELLAAIAVLAEVA